MKFFSLDSPFQKYGTILFDLIALNVFWLIITLATLGFLSPMTNSAMFNSINHTFIAEDGYMTRSFFTIFRRKLLRGLGLSLIGFLMYGLAAFNIWSVYSGMFSASFLMPFYLVLLAEIAVTMLFASALLAETDMSIKLLLKYGFLLSVKHALISLFCIVGIIGLAYLSVFVNPIFALIGVAPLFWYMGWLIYTKVFSKYYLDKLV